MKLHAFKKNKLFIIIGIFVLILFCILLTCLLDNSGDRVADAVTGPMGILMRRQIASDYTVYDKGVTYYHHINIYAEEQIGKPYDNTTIYCDSDFTFSWWGGRHHSGAFIYEWDSDMHVKLEFKLYKAASMTLVSTKTYETWYKAGKVKHGSGDGTWTWSGLESNTKYVMRLDTYATRKSGKSQYTDDRSEKDICYLYVNDTYAPYVQLRRNNISGSTYIGDFLHTNVSRMYISYSDAGHISEATFNLKTAIESPSTVTLSEGMNIVTVIDYLGNQTHRYLYYDKTPPTFTDLVDRKVYNEDVQVFVDDNFDNFTGSKKSLYYSYNASGSYPDTADEPYTIGSSFSKEGYYTVRAMDRAGNYSNYYHFIIDKTPASILLTGVTNGGFASSNVRVGYSDNVNVKSGTYSLNGKQKGSFANGMLFSSEGEYLLEVTDDAGNVSSVSFTIDKTKPTFTLNGVTPGGFTSSNVLAFITDTNLRGISYTRNGTAMGDYISGTALTAEGVYIFTAVDKAKNSNNVSFTIDKTFPRISLAGVTPGGFTSSNVSATITETNLQSATYTRNGTLMGNYTSGTALSAEGVYVITAIDKTNKSTSVSFTIDKTKPELKFNGASISNGATVYTNVSISVNAADKNIDKLYVNNTAQPGLTYSINSNLPNGRYTFYATDRAGNRSLEYTYYYDTTLPSINAVANNKNISSGSLVTQPASNKIGFTVTVGDTNSSGIEFLYFKKPNGTWQSQSNSQFSVSAGGLNGEYSFYSVDKAGNYAGGFTKDNPYVVKYDTVAPILTATTDTASIPSNTPVKKAFSISAADISPFFGAIQLFYKSPTMNSYGAANSDQYTVSANSVNGRWDFYSVDAAGNTSQIYTIYLDTKAPILSLIDADGNVIHFDESNQAYLNGVFTLNAAESKDNIYAGSGNVLLYFQDPNTTIFDDILTFQGNVFAPLYFSGAQTNGGSVDAPTVLTYCNSQKLVWSWASQSDGYALTQIKIFDDNNELLNTFTDTTTAFTLKEKEGARIAYTIEAEYNGVSAFYKVYIDTRAFNLSSTTTYSLDTATEGSYYFYATDRAGNQGARYEVIIDKTPPNGTLFEVIGGSSSELRNGRTRNDVKFRCSDPDLKEITLNGKSYKNNTIISAEGDYTIAILDRAGNVTSYSFIIDKTPPIGNLEGVSATGYSNQDVIFTWNESGAIATLNGAAYNSGDSISAEGSYEVVLRDSLGNAATYSFIIDKTPYTGNYDALLDIGTNAITHWWESYSYLYNADTHTQNIGSSFSFSSYNDALAYSRLREQALAALEAGVYTGEDIGCVWADVQNLVYYPLGTVKTVGMQYWIYYSKESKSTIYAYFDRAELNDAIEKWARAGVSEFYITDTAKVPAPAFTGGGNINAQVTSRPVIYINRTSFNFSKKNPAGISLSINNRPATYDFVFQAGNSYVIKETDLAGNEMEYIVYVDTALPAVKCLDASGNPISKYEEDFVNFNEIYTSQTWTISIEDYFDELAVMKIVTPSSGTKYFVGSESYTFSESGEYQITIADVSQNKKVFTLYVSLAKPTVSATENTTIQGQLLGFDLLINLSLPFNRISNISITQDGVPVTKDDNGVSILPGTLAYFFATSAEYIVVLQDNFGREINFTYFFDKGSPRGSLYVLPGTVVPNNTFTTKVVYFRWVDETCSAFIKKNGGEELEYVIASNVIEEGSYEIILRALDGKESSYFFTIDKTKPIGRLDGVENGGYTRSDVTFSWLAGENATISISFTSPTSIEKGIFIPQFTDGTSTTIRALSSHANDGTYIIRLTDAAGNNTDYSFTIDTTAPMIEIMPDNNDPSTLVPEYYNNVLVQYVTNQSFYFTWDGAADGEVITAGQTAAESYNKKSRLIEDGIYTLTVTDYAGNTVSATVKIDKSKPEGVLIGVKNGEITKNDVTFTWTEEGAAVTLNGAAYNSGDIISAEGQYTVVIINYLGTRSVYNFSIDKTAPVGYFTPAPKVIDDINYFNRYFSFAWSESSATATITKDSVAVPYSRGSNITEEGEYFIELTDVVGNITYYKAFVDKTAPEGALIGVTNGGFTNNNVSFSWADDTYKCTLNGYPYDGSLITEEGYYTIELISLAGNSSSYSFTIDKTAPTGNFSLRLEPIDGVYYFKNNVHFRWSETSATAQLDDGQIVVAYKSGSYIQDENSYKLVLSDRAGNSSSYSFVVDKTAPAGIFHSNRKVVEFNQYFNNYVNVDWIDTDVYTAMVNSEPYQKLQELSAEGEYSLILRDKAGNSTTYSFIIDKTPPSGSFSALYIENGNSLCFATATTFTWSEYGAIATLNGEPFAKRDSIIDDGSYELVLKDLAGNSTIYNIIIKKMSPSITFDTAGVEYEGSLYFKTDVMLSWIDTDCSVSINSEDIPSNTVISEEGSYAITITNIAGVKSIYNIIIDKTPPSGTLAGVENNGLTNNNVSFTWSESGSSAILNDAAYNSGTTIDYSGSFIIILTDIVGNSSTYSFTIDKTAPTGILVGVENGGITKSNVSFYWNAADNFTALLNGGAYNANSVISLEGDYTIDLINQLGNTTTYTFTIDKTSPIGALSGVNSLNFSNDQVSFTWDEIGATATLNGSKYIKDTIIKLEGEYTVLLTDRAGNSTTYSFIIDKSLPTGSLIGVIPGGVTSSNVTFQWDDPSATATLNGLSWDGIEPVSEEGEYTIVLTDLAGNSTAYSFSINKVYPSGTLDGVQDGGETNSDVVFTWENKNYAATLNGEKYLSGTVIKNAGNYTLILKNKENGLFTIYSFIIDKSEPDVTLIGVDNGGTTNGVVYCSWDVEAQYTATLNDIEYACGEEISIEGNFVLIVTNSLGTSVSFSFSIDKTAPVGTLDGVTKGGTTNKSVRFSWSEYSATATLDDVPYPSGMTISTEGHHVIIITDKYGNSASYSFTIDKTPPIGTLVGVNSNGYAKGAASLTWAEEGAYAKLGDQIYEKGTELTDENKYQITLFDVVGNSVVFDFIIDRTAPEGSFTEKGNYSDGIYNFSSSIAFIWKELSATATVQIDNGEPQPYASRSYLSASGQYTFVLRDKAGNQATYIAKIILPPTSIIITEDNGEISEPKEYTDGARFTYDAPISIAVPSGYKAYLNGDEILVSSVTLEKGSTNTLAFEDAAGNVIETTIIIAGDVSNSDKLSAVDVSLIVAGCVLFLVILTVIIKTSGKRKLKFKRG